MTFKGSRWQFQIKVSEWHADTKCVMGVFYSSKIGGYNLHQSIKWYITAICSVLLVWAYFHNILLDMEIHFPHVDHYQALMYRSNLQALSFLYPHPQYPTPQNPASNVRDALTIHQTASIFLRNKHFIENTILILASHISLLWKLFIVLNGIGSHFQLFPPRLPNIAFSPLPTQQTEKNQSHSHSKTELVYVIPRQ